MAKKKKNEYEERRIAEGQRTEEGVIKDAKLPPITDYQKAKISSDPLATEKLAEKSKEDDKIKIIEGVPYKSVPSEVAQKQAKDYSPSELLMEEQAQASGERRKAVLEAQRIGELTPEQIDYIQGAKEAPTDYGQALTAGIVQGVIPSAIAGLGAGAGIGAVAGAGVGALPGALIGLSAGAIRGLYSNTLSNIKKQQRGEISASTKRVDQARGVMRQLAMLTTQDPSNADKYIDAYNQQLAEVYRAREQLKLETQGNLNSFMEDGTEQLARMDIFLEPGGLAELYGQRIRTALQAGAMLSSEDLTAIEQEYGGTE